MTVGVVKKYELKMRGTLLAKAKVVGRGTIDTRRKGVSLSARQDGDFSTQQSTPIFPPAKFSYSRASFLFHRV